MQKVSVGMKEDTPSMPFRTLAELGYGMIPLPYGMREAEELPKERTSNGNATSLALAGTSRILARATLTSY